MVRAPTLSHFDLRLLSRLLQRRPVRQRQRKPLRNPKRRLRRSVVVFSVPRNCGLTVFQIIGSCIECRSFHPSDLGVAGFLLHYYYLGLHFLLYSSLVCFVS